MQLFRRLAVTGAASLLLAAPLAEAHGESSKDVRVRLGQLPRALSGLKVQLHETVAPQLVVENTTAATLEVLDERGRPFLKIGPQGVEADLGSLAWHRSYSPGAPIPALVLEGRSQPRWVGMGARPAWGWFDPRLQTQAVKVPHQVLARGRAAEVGIWKVPLRLGGVAVTLRGTFRFQPPVPVESVTRLLSPTELAPGVRVTVLPGRIPGLFLQNTGTDPVIVLGRAGEEFLEIGPEGVRGNVSSPTWRENVGSSTEERAVEKGAARPEWQRVSSASRFSWIELRARHPATEAIVSGAAAAGAAQEFSWEVPVRIGAETKLIAGVTVLQPVQEPARSR